MLPPFFLLKACPLLPNASVDIVTYPARRERLPWCLLYAGYVLHLFLLAGGIGGCLKEDSMSDVSAFQLSWGSVRSRVGMAQPVWQTLMLFLVLCIQSWFLHFSVVLLCVRVNRLFEVIVCPVGIVSTKALLYGLCGHIKASPGLVYPM